MSIDTKHHTHEPKIGRAYQYLANQGGYVVHYGHVRITVPRGPLFKQRLAWATHRAGHRHSKHCRRHSKREQAKQRVLGS